MRSKPLHERSGHRLRDRGRKMDDMMLRAALIFGSLALDDRELLFRRVLSRLHRRGSPETRRRIEAQHCQLAVFATRDSGVPLDPCRPDGGVHVGSGPPHHCPRAALPASGLDSSHHADDSRSCRMAGDHRAPRCIRRTPSRAVRHRRFSRTHAGPVSTPPRVCLVPALGPPDESGLLAGRRSWPRSVRRIHNAQALPPGYA